MTMTENPYYAAGKTVRVRPRPDAMGFILCRVDDYVESDPGATETPAETIARALNEMHARTE